MSALANTVLHASRPRPARRTPVIVVAGFKGAGKSSLIRRWTREVAGQERWAVLASEPGLAPPRATLSGGARQFRLPGGCPCCTAEIGARTSLIATLRSGPFDRLVIELTAAGHPGTLIDVLRRPPLSDLLELTATVAVVDTRHADTYLAGEQASESRHLLARSHLEAADLVVVNRLDELDPARREALLGELAGRHPFERAVGLAEAAQVPWPAGAGCEAEPAGAGGQLPAVGTAAAATATTAASADGEPRRLADGSLHWRWPVETVFERASLKLALDGLVAEGANVWAAGAFRTEREWIGWHAAPGPGHWQTTAFRRENLLVVRDFGGSDPGRLERRLRASVRGG